MKVTAVVLGLFAALLIALAAGVAGAYPIHWDAIGAVILGFVGLFVFALAIDVWRAE